jgi:hypothetical protein
MRWDWCLAGVLVLAAGCGGGGGGGGSGGSGGGSGGSGGSVDRTDGGATHDAAGGHGGGGSGGTGGMTGGTGGMTGGTGGMTGGTGGMSGGSGGSGGAATLNECQEKCTGDEQCAMGNHCVDARCVPAQATPPCNADADCVPVMSGWTQACHADADCPGSGNGTQACIAANGGVCAVTPSMLLPCATLAMVEAQQQRLDGSMVTVCEQDRASCTDQHTCTVVCRDDANCSGEYPHCDVASGRCTCTEGSCHTNATVCGADGFCHCAGDADCSQGPFNVCVDGNCGCRDASVCPAQHLNPGTQWVCEPFHLPGQ